MRMIWTRGAATILSGSPTPAPQADQGRVHQQLYFTSVTTDNTSSAQPAGKLSLQNFQNDDLYNVNANSELLDSLNEQIGMMSAMLGASPNLPSGGRRGRHEHHAGVGDGADQGNRHPQGPGGEAGVIMQQFVIEAAMTSSIGGVIGICWDLWLPSSSEKLWESILRPLSAIVISFSVSVGIGLFFGYMPASRAAKLNPIDALRSE